MADRAIESVLTMGPIALIRKAEAERSKDAPNRTRLYNVVVPLKRNGECRIDTYAVKTRRKKTGELAIKKVAKYWPEKRKCEVRDILWSNFWHCWSVNWCNEPFGHKHQAVWEDVDAYIGIWGADEATYKHCIDLHAEYLNGFEGTRYARCGYDTDRIYVMHFMQYIECWNINHATEFLAKARMWNLIRPRFIKRLSTDKGLMRFFRNHIHDIEPNDDWRCCSRYGVGAIERAYRHNETLDEARDYLSFLGETSHLNNIPKTVDRKRLMRYLAKHKVDAWAYDRYCYMLHRLGMDIRAYGYMFPSRWTKRYDEVDEAHKALVAQEEAERRAEFKRQKAAERREAKRRLEHWKFVCGYVDEAIVGKLYGGYVVKVLRDKEDLIAEGNEMKNCIGTYGQDVKEGRALLLSLRKDDQPVYDIEIDPLSFKVIQAREKENGDAPKEIHDIARKIALQARQGVRESKHMSKRKKSHTDEVDALVA